MLSNIYKHTFNCGNIRYSAGNHWLGQIGRYKGFCKFDSEVYGLRALVVLVRNYIRSGCDTVERIISRYAPNTENDLKSYMSFIFMKSGLRPDDKIVYKSHSFYCLLYCISYFETGYVFTEFDLENIYICFGL